MKKLIRVIISSDLKSKTYNFAILFFRVAVATELLIVHGLKKIGIGVAMPEVIPNPLGFPEAFNNFVAIAANVYLPILVILGFLTRLAALPALAVTATGYFVMHGHDSLAERDIPFMFSISLLMIIMLGGGKYSLDGYLNKRLN
ncbi:DoxX family protein [Flavobacterium sp. NRK1]|uniref:DoxX family protein n=1 Tax=Flavobacterium sp. NRK1 TaxID=2954929 RepID=UPI002091FFCE|nr:DoxX family protein [Flavobacterium sp. NRK1]MCO6148645.1 DoxX family protein [Flavobacterium sp. NRK1]